MTADVAPQIEGYVENITTDAVAGWGWEAGSDRPIVVQIFFHDLLLGEVVANQYRKDLHDGGKGAGNHAFEFTFPEPLPDAAARSAIRARVDQTDRFLAHTAALTQRLAKPSTPFPMPRPEEANAAPKGEAASTRVEPRAGWVAKLGLAQSELRGVAQLERDRSVLLVTIDGDKLEEVTIADGEGDGAAGPRGFCVPVPARWFDGGSHTVVVFDAWSGKRLDDGTATLPFPALIDSRPTAADPPPALADGSVIVRLALVVTEASRARAAWLATLCGASGLEVTMIAADGPAARDPHTPTETLEGLRATYRHFASGAGSPSGTAFSAVVISSPQIAALAIGLAVREASGCALLVDIDEANTGWLQRATEPGGLDPDAPLPEALDHPIWVALADGLIDEADGWTVSNPGLRRRFGGMLVRSGRAPDWAGSHTAAERLHLRTAAGYTERDRIIVLHGPLHIHDGVVEIADALERMADDRLVLCVIGSIADRRIVKRLHACKQARIDLRLDTPPERAAEYLAIADGVPVLQRATHLEAQMRVPDRLIDALAAGVPVLATPAQPLEELVQAGAVSVVADPGQLEAALRVLASAASPPSLRRGPRGLYQAEFSTAVNAARLRLAVTDAMRQAKPAHTTTAVLLRALGGEPSAGAGAPSAGRSRAPLPRAPLARDLVLLAGDNDSDLPHRRSEAIARGLLALERVRHVIQFDAQLSAARLEAFAAASGEAAHRGSLIYANTVRRVLEIADGPGWTRRTFLHRNGKRTERIMGRDLPPANLYPSFVREALAHAGAGERPVLLVCGAAADFTVICEAVDPALVVLDLADTMSLPEETGALDRADVVVCSTAAAAAAFADRRRDILCVPDAAEGDAAQWQSRAADIWRAVERDE